MGCFPEARKNDFAERLDAARMIGLPDHMANEIQIIDGFPEWRPPQVQIAKPAKIVVEQIRRSPPWPNHG